MISEFEDDCGETIACTREMFTEVAEVLEMIDNLKNVYKSNFELHIQHFTNILKFYQEQPHLLDPHLDDLLEKLMSIIRNKENEDQVKHAAFKYMFIITSVRSYKVIVTHLSHEITDLEPILLMLEEQNITDEQTWETRYMLLIWLSMIVINPFHLSRLDNFTPEQNSLNQTTVMQRILNICYKYSLANDSCFSAASVLASKFLTRSDVKDKYLSEYFNWACDINRLLNNYDVKYGVLAAVATILKHGKRDDFIPFVDQLLLWIANSDFKNSPAVLVHKYAIKIIQRIGLILLAPQLAPWRYQRGNRSLLANLSAGDSKPDAGSGSATVRPEPEDVQVPEQIEEVLEELMQGLKNCDGIVRWSAAKGIGRVTGRLPHELADEVLGSLLEIFSPHETHHGWHGGCLALAELAKRGLLLPQRLPEIVPIVLEALRYDVVQGFVSVGAHIRDAACYVSWAFARAYEASVLAPFTNQIASSLIATAVFDREVNVRRAASAAFQENVGRLGTFPHGIDILTAADFFSVGIRTNAYLDISVYIAQFPEYTVPLIDHLVDLKVDHWDCSIRELCASALHRLLFKDPEYVIDTVMPKLLAKTQTIDVNSRHGAILAIGEIVYAVSLLAELEHKSLDQYLPEHLVEAVGNIIPTVRKRDQFKGLGGELMKQACTDLIKNVSKAKVPYSQEITDEWQQLLEECLSHRVPLIRQRASNALPDLLNMYYSSNDKQVVTKVLKMIERFTSQLKSDSEINRMGFAIAIGSFPPLVVKSNVNIIVTELLTCSKIYGRIKWAESRRDAIKALASICQTVGVEGLHDHIDKIFSGFLESLEEYTIDNRGDIGAWVREAAMTGLHTLILLLVNTEYISPDKVSSVMLGLAQQAVEKIDRTRAHAGKLFTNLVHSLPFVPRNTEVEQIFPPGSSESISWLFAQHTFPKFCQLLALPEYSQAIMQGLVISIGDLTETLMKHSSVALFSFLKSLHNRPDELERLGRVITHVFSINQLNDRVSLPMLVFLDLLISSGSMNPILNTPESKFAEEVFVLTKCEIKGCRKLYKILSSINVFCQLIQVDKVRKRSLSQICVLLGHALKHVRKTASIRFYEALIVNSDCLDIPEEDFDTVMTLLAEGDWDGSGAPISSIREVRNEVCTLLGINPPISPAPSNMNVVSDE